LADVRALTVVSRWQCRCARIQPCQAPGCGGGPGGWLTGQHVGVLVAGTYAEQRENTGGGTGEEHRGEEDDVEQGDLQGVLNVQRSTLDVA
jgi:hypothetical protein